MSEEVLIDMSGMSCPNCPKQMLLPSAVGDHDPNKVVTCIICHIFMERWFPLNQINWKVTTRLVMNPAGVVKSRRGQGTANIETITAMELVKKSLPPLPEGVIREGKKIIYTIPA